MLVIPYKRYIKTLHKLSIWFVNHIKKLSGPTWALVPYEDPVLPVQEVLLCS